MKGVGQAAGPLAAVPVVTRMQLNGLTNDI